VTEVETLYKSTCIYFSPLWIGWLEFDSQYGQGFFTSLSCSDWFRGQLSLQWVPEQNTCKKSNSRNN